MNWIIASLLEKSLRSFSSWIIMSLNVERNNNYFYIFLKFPAFLRLWLWILKTVITDATLSWAPDMFYIHIMEYYSSIKRNKIPIYATPWMKLKTKIFPGGICVVFTGRVPLTCKKVFNHSFSVLLDTPSPIFLKQLLAFILWFQGPYYLCKRKLKKMLCDHDLMLSFPVSGKRMEKCSGVFSLWKQWVIYHLFSFEPL